MADAEDELEIELEDGPEAGDDDTPLPGEKKPEKSFDEAMEALKRERDDARGRAEAAEARAAQSDGGALEAARSAHEANLNLITGAIDSLNGDRSNAKRLYQDAMENGDFAKAAEINDALSEIVHNIKTLQDAEGRFKAEGAKLTRTQPRRADPSDPVDVYATANQLDDRAKGWLRAHPEFVTDKAKEDALVEAHFAALGKRIQNGSQAYYDFVEKKLGLKDDGESPSVERKTKEAANGSAGESVMSGASAATQRRSAPPAAPVSRSGTANGATPGRITLSKAERETAISLADPGETEQQALQRYAKNKLALIKEGRMN